MITVEISDVRVANLVRDAIDEKIVERKSLLHTEIITTETAGSMDMVSITNIVNDINALSEVSSQLSVKIQFPAEG